MSLILDALKKLDREKLFRRKGMPDLAAEVLRPDPPRPRKRIPSYVFAVALTAVLTAAVTYALIVKPGLLRESSPTAAGGPAAARQRVAAVSPESVSPAKASPPPGEKLSSPGQKPSSAPAESLSLPKPSPPSTLPEPGPRTPADPQKSPAPSKPSLSASAGPPARGREAPPVSKKSLSLPQSSPAPPAASPAPKEQASSPSPPPKPASEPQTGIPREPLKTADRGESKSPAISAGDQRASPQESFPKAGILPGSPAKAAEPLAGSSPQLKISGIVWNEEPSQRRAVVNGSFATEGSVIEGVKVVEIFPTRVRFLHQGRYFEISVF